MAKTKGGPVEPHKQSWDSTDERGNVISFEVADQRRRHIVIKGIDEDGNHVDIDVVMIGGTITEDGQCRFI